MSDLLSSRIKMLEALPPLREVIAAHDLRAEKSLGQNFLLDLNITDKIVRHVKERYQGNWNCVNALEIGPGPGGLTRSLLKSGVAGVTAVEFDSRAVGALESLGGASEGALKVLQADALEIDLRTICDAPRIIVANLPYNIATPLLIGWMRHIRLNEKAYDCMALMFQKEVADRITAKPNTKAYGRLAIMAQWLCRTEKLFDLPPSAFTPAPKVTSSVVMFTPRNLTSCAPSFESVESLTAAAFQQRRKMIRSSLKAYMPAIEALGLDPQARAETLSVQDFLNIASF